MQTSRVPHRPARVAKPSRRKSLGLAFAAAAALMAPATAAPAAGDFAQWVARFRAKALARGISGETYDRAMDGLRPDTTGLAAIRTQPEFNEQIWQYLNRRVSDWRVIAGKEKANEYAALFSRIEKDFGVERSVMLGVWGVESAFGDPIVQQNHMRPVFPRWRRSPGASRAGATIGRRELINALPIVQQGWSTPAEMIGSWAGAMGHTQWMPEVWLHVGIDYDRDGRINRRSARPTMRSASTARYFVQRGKYRRGEHWGYEVRMPARHAERRARAAMPRGRRLGVTRADGEAFPQPNATARPWVPVPGGPAFLLGPNFFAVRTYNPSMNYTLSLVHLGDRCVGGEPFVQKFPGAERTPTLAEVQEIQRRLTALGFDTSGADGRVGNETMLAVRKFQRKVGMEPADGYPGIKLLARLRQGL